jgi:hypothetical protein
VRVRAGLERVAAAVGQLLDLLGQMLDLDREVGPGGSRAT